jgi:hypothetical protein
MFDTYFGLQKTVSVESLSNRINSFMSTVCAKEQCNPAHPIVGSPILLLLEMLELAASLLDCAFC